MELFVKKQKRKDGRVYLSVVEGYRGEDGGTKTRHVRSLGYLDELEKAYDDPIAHFKAEMEAVSANLLIDISLCRKSTVR